MAKILAIDDELDMLILMLTSQTLPTQCHLTYKKSMALGYKLLAL